MNFNFTKQHPKKLKVSHDHPKTLKTNESLDISSKNMQIQSKFIDIIAHLQNDVQSMIEYHSNIETIVREIGSWRIFKEIIFSKHHFKLLPLVEIEMERKRKKFKQLRKEREVRLSQTSSIDAFKDVSSLHSDELDFNEALEMLSAANPNERLAHDEALTDFLQLKDTLRKGIDDFFKENLPDFVYDRASQFQFDSSPKDNMTPKPPPRTSWEEPRLDPSMAGPKVSAEETKKPTSTGDPNMMTELIKKPNLPQVDEEEDRPQLEKKAGWGVSIGNKGQQKPQQLNKINLHSRVDE